YNSKGIDTVILDIEVFSPLNGIGAPSMDQNYILTYSPREPIFDKGLLVSSSITEVNKSVQYLDELGRPMQTVHIQASPDKQDLVVPIAYDTFGREPRKYLPYAASGSLGKYKADALMAGSGIHA